VGCRIKGDRRPDEIEKKKTTREDVNRAPARTTLAPKSDEPTVLIPFEQQIQQRAHFDSVSDKQEDWSPR